MRIIPARTICKRLGDKELSDEKVDSERFKNEKFVHERQDNLVVLYLNENFLMNQLRLKRKYV